jgi:hypothetical protein
VVEGFEVQLGAGITGQHELFEQVIEMADQSVTEAESVLAGQALQQGHKPADQIKAGFNDWQLAAAGGAGVGGNGHGLCKKNREAPTAPKGKY